MARPYQVQKSRADWIIGFIIPLGIFIEAGSPILLATSPIGQDGLFVPLSLILLPFALVLRVVRGGGGHQTYPTLFTYAAIAFSVYALVMSAVSALTIDSIAILYGLQWAMTFAWLPYFSTLHEEGRLRTFLKGFVAGVLLNVGFYALSGVLEIALYGGLQDAGRLTQNLILVGQYQVATYLPTLVVYSFLVVVALQQSQVLQIGKGTFILLAGLSLLVIVFLASRESVLVLVAFVILMGLLRGGAARISALFFLVLVVVAVLNLDALASVLRASEFRLFDKVANLSAEGNALAGRDVMVEDVLQIIRANPVFGTYFLPPNSGINNLRVEAPSAHNMYVDVFAWSGFLGALVFCLGIVSVLSTAFRRIVDSYRRNGSDLGGSAAILLVILLLISNNINVPMRQPLISPIFALLVFLCCSWRSSSVRQAPYA